MDIKVCIGSACHLKGSYQVIKNIKEYISDHGLENKVELKSSFCLGKCSEAVSVEFNNEAIVSMTPEAVNDILDEMIPR